MANENLVIRISATGGAQVSRESAKGAAGLRGYGAAADDAGRATAGWRAATEKQKESLRSLAGYAKVAAISGAVVLAGGLAHVVKTGAEYESQMARVQAVSSANNREMASLNRTAIKLGADTKYSASEAAAGMYELSSAGFSVREMVRTIPGTMSLAAASNIELADAAEISSNALRGFGLPARDSARVADILAESVNRSSLEMRDLQMSIKYVGPIAKATGQDIETVVGALGLMADAGIKGEQAGTTIRSALLSLTHPIGQTARGLRDVGISAEDLQGPNGLKPLPEIIRILDRSMAGYSKAQRNAALAQIFGTEAASGMFQIMDAGPEKLERVSKALANSGGAARKAAKTMNDTLPGAWEEFMGSVETVEIQLYQQFQAPMKDALRDVTRIVNTQGAELQAALEKTMAMPEFKQGDLGTQISMLADVAGEQWKKSGFQDDIEDAMIDAFNWAIPKVAEGSIKLGMTAVEGMATGFAESDIWGKLLIGGWLMSKLGGFRALDAAGMGIGSLLSGGVSKGFAHGAAAFDLAQSFDRSRTSSAAAAAGAAGWSWGDSMVKGMARAVPSLAVAYGLSDILTKAVSGDTEGAAKSAGGAAAGAVIGGLVGGIPGAMVGSGLGAALGGPIFDAIGDIFDSGDGVSKMRDRLQSSAASLASALKTEGATAGAVRQSAGVVERARDRQAAATRRVNRAERALIEARKKYGPGTQPVIMAEARLANAKDRSATATRNARRAERLHGVQLQAAKAVYRSSVIEAKNRIETLKDQRQHSLRLLKTENQLRPGGEEQARLYRKVNGISQELNKTQGNLGKTLQRAARDVGPKYAKSLQDMRGSMASVLRLLPPLERAPKPLKESWLDIPPAFSAVARSAKTQFGKATDEGKKFRKRSGDNNDLVIENFRGLNEPVRESLSTVTLDLGAALKGIGSDRKIEANFSNIPRNAKGGINRVAGNGLRDTVPLTGPDIRALVAPGEDLAVINRHQRPMLDHAVNQAYGVGGLDGFFRANNTPHYFASGGIRKPSLSGSPDRIRDFGQAGADRYYDAATDLFAEEKKKREQAKAAAGGSPNYTGPPADMKKLGDPAWVDSHTLAVGDYLAKRFNTTITDGWRPQDAGYGAANSSHKRGTPSNPGALDFAAASAEFQTWAGQHIAGLTENLLNDAYSTGPHNHLAFFERGGLLRSLQELAGGGWVRTGYTTYSGEGGAWGTLGKGDAFAELGTATSKGVGTGVGLLAEAFGMSGELGEGFPIDIKVGSIGKVGRLYNRDRGYGQGDPFYAIDIHDSGFDQVGLSGDNKGIAYARPAEGAGRGSSKVDKEKQRRASEKAKLEDLYRKARKAKTLPGRRAAYWDLIEHWGKVGEFGEKEEEYTLNQVKRAASQVNPFGAIPILRDVAKYLDKNIEVGPKDSGLGKAFARVKGSGARVGKRKRKKKLRAIAGRGLAQPTRDRIKSNEKGIGSIDEMIEMASQLASAESGPSGSEFTDSETGNLVGLNTNLQKRLVRHRGLLQHSIGTIREQLGKESQLSKDIADARPKGSHSHWKLPGLLRRQANAKSLIREDLRPALEDVQGVTGKGGRLFDVKLAIDELGFQAAPDSMDSPTADLLQQQVSDLQRQLALSRSGSDTFDGWLGDLQRETPPWAGYFSEGGTVPGPIGAPRHAIVHGGEEITPPGKSNAPIVNVYVDPVSFDVRVETIVEGVLRKQLFRSGQLTPQGGRSI